MVMKVDGDGFGGEACSMREEQSAWGLSRGRWVALGKPVNPSTPSTSPSYTKSSPMSSGEYVRRKSFSSFRF